MAFSLSLDKNQFLYTDRTDDTEFSIEKRKNPSIPRNPCTKEGPNPDFEKTIYDPWKNVADMPKMIDNQLNSTPFAII